MFGCGARPGAVVNLSEHPLKPEGRSRDWILQVSRQKCLRLSWRTSGARGLDGWGHSGALAFESLPARLMTPRRGSSGLEPTNVAQGPYPGCAPWCSMQ